MNSLQLKFYSFIFTTGIIGGFIFGGGIALSQPADTPNSPPAIQEESSSSNEQGEIVERGITRRDHRGQPKVLAPPTSTSPSQSSPVPLVRDHRLQPGGTTSSAPVSLSQGAPPPIGPPDPVAPVKDLPIHLLITNARDAAGNNIGVRGQVDRAVAAANANAAQQTSVRAKIKVESFTFYGAQMSATTYTDRPNHRYVRIPYMVGYKVYDVKKNVSGSWVSTSVTRQLSQSITIQMFCDRWETGKGSLKLAAKIDRPYMDPNQGGTLEQVVNFFLNGHLTDFIDSQVRQQINSISIQNASTNLNLDCNALGRDKGDIETPTDDLILYSYTIPKPTLPTINSQLSLTLQSIKRLAAHNLQGQPLYAATETPTLEVFANQRLAVVQLPSLQEGQQVPVAATPIVLPVAGLTNLSVLVNVRQPNITQVDSTTRVYGQNVSYGHGTQTIRVPKAYWTQANPKTGVKPQQIFVDAYELTFRINAPGNLTADPGLGTSPTLGTVKPGLFNQAIQVTIMKRGVEGEQPDNSTIEQPQTESESDNREAQPSVP